ncbi:MAG: transposase [Ferruginibacter sp.]
MQKIEQLQQGKFYHIYNRGINSEALFYEADNYDYFIKLYENHIDPIAETYAWCLMKNHFHFLIRIKEDTEKLPHQCFSNLFNAYTKSINKKYNRHSSLFQRPFKRKLIDNEMYFKNLIIYIHNNPVNHGICENAMDYAWSSYLTCVSNKTTKLKREEVINYFNDVSNFKFIHKQNTNALDIECDLDF